MKKLETVKLESYETPAIQEIMAMSVVHGGVSQDPTNPGGDSPVDDDDL